MVKPKFYTKLIYLAIVAAIALCLWGLPYFATVGLTQTTGVPPLSPDRPTSIPEAATEAPRPNGLGPTDPQEVEAFLDGFIYQEMKNNHIPGAAIAIVKDGEVFLTKGYGYANVEKQIPVDPDRTLFRVASLSKLFTDTAAMQLYERGSLDLHADINSYLQDWQIETPYPQPISAANLMTQTSGISRRQIGIAASTPANMEPLESFLRRKLPPIAYPPGEIYYYSNVAITLLGYLVEQITNTPFIQYLDRNLLQPLDMQRSSFQQPLPPELASDLAVGYQYRGGEYRPVPFLYLNIFPAAALSTTATDIAHFMLANLQQGRYQNRPILQPETVQLMQKRHFTHHPKLPGTAYGFHERLVNNMRTIGHAGNLRGYSSSITLIPDRNLGIFITVNSFTGLHEPLLKAFFDRYYPVQNASPPPQPSAEFNMAPARFAGTYRDLEYPRETLAKVAAPFSHLHIKVTDNQTLRIKTANLFSSGSPIRREVLPVDSLLFQGLSDRDYTAFAENENGEIAYTFNPIGPKLGAFQKVPWYETVLFQFALAGVSGLIFLTGCWVWLGDIIKTRWGKTPLYRKDKMGRIAWLVAGLVCLLDVAFLIGFPFTVWWIGLWKLVYGVPTVAIAWLCLPPISTGLTVALPVFAVWGMRQQSWSVWERSHYSIITLAAFGFTYFLVYWNLLGFNF